MPAGAFVPSRIHIDYPEWAAPGVGNVGQVWAWNGSGYAPVSLAFDPVGTAAAAVAAHVEAANPHSQYYLASGVSAYGATLASAADAAAARSALALGTAAIYNVGTGANNIVQLDGSSRLPAVDGSQLTGISGGSVAGSNTQVIINDGGVYAGDAGLTYAKATDRLTVVGGIVAGDWSPPSDSTTAVSVWNAARTTRVVTVDTTNSRIRSSRIGVNVDASASYAGYFSQTSSNTNDNAIRAEVTIGGDHQNISAGYFQANIGYAMTKSLATAPVALRSFIFTVDTSGTTANVVGFRATSQIRTGTAVTNLYDVHVTEPTINGTGVVNTHYGLYVDALSAATTNYAVYTNAGMVRFGDRVILSASTTNRSSMTVTAGTAPTTPNAGDIWYPTGGRLNVYRAATETIASGVPGSGGAATATGTWGATEMAMLQAVYDVARSFGMLS